MYLGRGLVAYFGRSVAKQDAAARHYFSFFAVLFGWVSMNLIPASVCAARAYPAWRCFIVQHAGLFFIWLIAAMDACQGARIRRTEFDFSQGKELPLQTGSRNPDA